MSTSSQSPGRGPNAQKYRNALDAAIEAARHEYLTDNTGTPEDEAYNQGVSDVIAAITQLRDGGAPPQTQTPRPVDPTSKAARLANLIATKFPNDAMTELIDGETLNVYVAPTTLGDWDWWLERFHVPVGTVTHRGSYATAKGNRGSVQVLLTGTGVPALYAAERTAAIGGGS